MRLGRKSCAHAVGIVAALLIVLVGESRRSAPVSAASEGAGVAAVAPLDQPDRVCAQCHREIYEKYEQTSMARGGGVAADGLLRGRFHHQPSDIDYSVFLRDGAAWMSYKRPASDPKGALSGEERLQYFIGSGHRGRTYLYQAGKQWFELPINFYTRRNGWDMAPAFEQSTSLPAPLPVDPNCLHCHATAVQPSLPGARNSFATIPFRQAGVGCSQCHGDPSAHLWKQGHGSIVNPGKLPAAQQESACIQCHLEGEAVVYRPGRSLAQFVPGDNLSDIAVYFVRKSQQTGGARATSQYEALLNSACRRAAGEKLTCTTCHDPHYDPSPSARVQYFRARCLSCHRNPEIAAKHFPVQQDCAACHMPSRSTADISHEQVTDHDIEAKPQSYTPRSADARKAEELVPVGNFAAGDREYGLAYAQAALRGLPGAAEAALKRLTLAAEAGATDEEVNVRLGYLMQTSGQPEKAREYYSLALKADPHEPTALANLAVIDASTNRLPEAMQLLTRLMDADPSQTAAGLNLAFIECKLGRPEEAHALMRRLERLNPDDPRLREFLKDGSYAGQHCALPPEVHSPGKQSNGLRFSGSLFFR